MQKKMKERIERMVEKVIAYFGSEKQLTKEFNQLSEQDKYMLQHYGGAWLLYFYETINIICKITIEDSEHFTFIRPSTPRLSVPCLDKIIEISSESAGVEILMVTSYVANVENWVQDINRRQIFNGEQRPDRRNRFTYAGSVNAAIHEQPDYPRFSCSSRSMHLL